jgi:hypothetical protein
MPIFVESEVGPENEVSSSMTCDLPVEPESSQSPIFAPTDSSEEPKSQAFELIGDGETVAPYVIVTDGDKQVLRTRYASELMECEWIGFKSEDPSVDQPR